MSSDIAIKINGLSKCFHIYEQPRDRLKQSVLPRFRRILGLDPRSYHRNFWALRDIEFEVRRGDTVGIIGRNGSGKSTLLQILCGTLAPSAGTVEVNGRVAALLELGAGFNPEFTGKENVFLSASFYGLTEEQTRERYNRIIEFANIGEHVDQPVKTYSSGMFVRLAFAVIAHVDADILVIDEALSVGDAVFTQKCMRFIREFQKKGTLLFVSHDMNSVLNLCRYALWLEHGDLRQMGESREVAEAYLKANLQEVYGEEAILAGTRDNSSTTEFKKTQGAVDQVANYQATASITENLSSANGWKTGSAEILQVQLRKLDGVSEEAAIKGGELVKLIIRAKAYTRLEMPILGFLFRDRLGQDLFGENTLAFTGLNPTPIPAGSEFQSEFVFRLPMLPNGQYAVMASAAEGDLYNNVQHHLLHDALIINVSSSKVRWGLVGLPFEQASLKCLS